MSEIILNFLLLFLILLVFGTAAYASFKASPWLPVRKKDMERILKLAQVKENDLVYDLGSGDGRVVIAIANNSDAQVVGFEISLLPYLWSKIRIWFLGLAKRLEIRYGDFLKRDLGQAKVIFCFLTPMAMKKLDEKFRKELKQGTKIISYSFSMPNWTAKIVDKPDKKSIPIFVYEVDT